MRGKVAVYKGGKKYLGERRREEGRGYCRRRGRK